MKVNMDFNNFDKTCLNSLWLKLVASYAISQSFTSQMKRIVTHPFLSPFLSLTEQFVVGAGKQSKQNPTESRECNLPAFFYRLFASLHCRKHTLPVPTTSPLPKKKFASELSSICDFVKAPMLLETIRNDDFHRITAL